MLSRVGERFLHNVQHLQLQIRRERQAVTLYGKLRVNSTLMFEFFERRLQCKFNVFIARTCTKMQQQFAYVAVAFAYACVNFAHGLLNQHCVAARLPIIFSEGVSKGRISLDDFVRLTATQPARPCARSRSRPCPA